ncbi:MAG: MBL fold metallo-hydrolase [Deltaproteobacteria bacterium]|nr:MBL fold metallo-hydrolase [Deltaproteobacteria bacterium]
MPDRAALHGLKDGVQRLQWGALHVDLIQTSAGTVRVGSMPDVAKIMARLGLREQIVVIPRWKVSQAGDNHTGEEFVQWHAQVYGCPRRTYIGTPKDLSLFYRNLAAIFSYYFDPKRLSIVRKRWLSRWVEKHPVETSFERGDFRALFAQGNLMLLDHGRKVYDLRECGYRTDSEEQVEGMLADVPRDSRGREDLEITVVGSGNGFFGTTASFVARFGKAVLWIDPCAQPACSLAQVGIHWDDITDVLITHNHEDHIAGFSACLKRKTDRGEKLRLITAPSVYEVLRKQFRPLFPEMDRHISFTQVSPGKILELSGMRIETRWNHHFLPYGTLGIKIQAGGRMWGFSGDTKLDAAINAVLKRPELSGRWFRDCDLVFHEVDFHSPDGVHTYWKEVDRLRDEIAREVFVYHTQHIDNAPLPIARQGETYRPR